MPRRRARGVPGRPRAQPLARPLAGRRRAAARHQPRRRQPDRRPAAPGRRHRPRSRTRPRLDQHRAWRHVPLQERRARVAAALDALTEHRELLALLLVWEIGKPWRLAQADVDRAIDGVRWYVDGIEPMLEGRTPAATAPSPTSPSWNYPMSVLVHAMLVQALAGNAVIAKTPTDGGVACLTLACALAAREGIPVTLVSGSGGELSEALVRAPEIGCVSFVGGRDTGAAVATAVADLGKRHVLEQEGLNTWGIWNFSDWDALTAARSPRLFDYGKQRCTAYPRFVVQRSLFDDFLAAYLPAVALRPVRPPAGRRAPRRPATRAGLRPADQRGQGARSWHDQVAEAIDRGAVPLHRGSLDRRRASCPARTLRRTSRPSRCSTRRRPPRCTTRSPSARSTPSSWSTPRRSCWPR